jgi:hypothetical protein
VERMEENKFIWFGCMKTMSEERLNKVIYIAKRVKADVVDCKLER